jgi:hypothetical protein
MKRLLLLFAFAGTSLAQSPQSNIGQAVIGSRTATDAVHPDCSGQNASSCEEHTGLFSSTPAPGGGGHRTLVFNELKTYGPSINFGNSGGWTVTHVIEAPHIIFGTSGIDQYEGANIIKNGTGDLAGLYFYVFGGGRAAQSDEGVTGLTVESGEINGYFHGTIAGDASTGSTSLNLKSAADAPHNWLYTCDGCMLLDISKGNIAGLLNGKSHLFASTYLYELPTTGVTISGASASLPLTHAWCQTLTAIPASTQAGVGTARTVSCTLGTIGNNTPTFTAGGVVSIAGPYYPEQATLTAVGSPSGGVQSLTLVARNPNPAGAVIFQGGIAGQSLSFDANLAASGFRSSYYVFGSVDGANLIYGSQTAGSIKNASLPRIGSEAEQYNSGFHLYPSAEIVANTATPSAPMLEPNNVAWASGDTVENPRFQSFGGSGIRDVCQQFTPNDGSNSSACMMMDLMGSGISGAYHPFRIFNHNTISMYRQGGGALDPVAAMAFDGPFGDLLWFHNGPSSGGPTNNSVIEIMNTAKSDGTPFNLFTLPSDKGGNGARITYDPVSRNTQFPQGLAAGTLGTTANCSSAAKIANCGPAASGSVVIAPGANSVTVGTYTVTANSEILITPDASLGAKLGITCNNEPAVAFAPFGITARTPGRSFVLSTSANVSGSPACYSFLIVN